jgi:glycosyltransferase involved in cell wall biosynthesis
MKILRVASDLYPYVVGGIGLHTHNLSIRQVRDGHEVMVFTCIPDNPNQSLNEAPYHIVDFGRKLSLSGNTFCLNMFRLLYHNRYTYDVIDAHSHLFISTNLCALVRRWGSSPLVITNHGLRSQAVPALFQEIYLRTIGRWTLNSADKIITFTEGERGDLIRIGVSPEKIMIIPNAVDTELFCPSENNGNGFNVIWAGRLNAGKGIKYAILGFEEFLKTKPEAKLFIIGDGPYYQNVLDYVQMKNLERNIIVTGRVENSEIISYYTHSDAYLMTSMSEGFPRTLLEAMACGLPVICTDIPQLVPIVEQCGIVIPKKDPESVRNALEVLNKNENLRWKYGKNGRSLVENNHSLKQLADASIKLFSELIEEEGGT